MKRVRVVAGVVGLAPAAIGAAPLAGSQPESRHPAISAKLASGRAVLAASGAKHGDMGCWKIRDAHIWLYLSEGEHPFFQTRRGDEFITYSDDPASDRGIWVPGVMRSMSPAVGWINHKYLSKRAC